MNGPAMLADHLTERNEEIIALWRSAVERRGGVPAAEGLTYEEFVDHIPALLDRLADRLRGRESDPEPEARQHGWLRWRQGYDVSQVVNELGHLRTALRRASFEYAHDRGFDLDQVGSMMEAIDTVIDEAMSDSVTQFQQDTLGRTREALEQAEVERARLATVLDYIPACVWVTDAEGNLVAESVDSAEAQGFRLEDLDTRINVTRGHEPHYQIYSRDGKPVPPGQAPAVRALQGEAFRGEEFHWRNALGERAYLVSAVPMQDAFGQITGAVVVALDMTDQRRLENAIRESEERYRVTVENAAIGINQLGLDGRWHRVNSRYGEIVGRDPETIEGTSLSDLTHPEDHTELAVEIEALLRGDVERVRRELRQFLATGETVWVEMSLSPAFDEQGNLDSLVAIVQDVSARKQAELVTTRYQMLSERSRDIMLFIHPEGYRIIEANEAAVRAYGYPREQLLGMSLVNLRAAETLEDLPEQFAKANREGLLLETAHRRRNGETFPVEISAQGADVGGERLVLSIIREITDRKRLEADLARQSQLAEESSRHKTRLLTALSHDARTPLNAVVLSAELLEAHAQDAADPEVCECVRTIRDSVHNVLDLLNDLLNLTRIDSGALPVEVSRFDLLQAVSECVSSIEGQCRAKGLDCRLEPEGFRGLVVDSDRAKLKQILSNLLANAYRYTETGQVRISASRSDAGLEISVSDTGIGIAPEDQERIFQEFARVSSGHLPADGTGLGLAICRRLASLLRGEIRLRSTLGSGSTFSLFLPGEIVAQTKVEPRIAVLPKAPPSGSAGAILVAEDHNDSRAALARALRRMGYRVLEAENGREVLAVIRSERPLAILMDVNMPVMDGIEATEAIRADPTLTDLPIFALTGDVTAENQRRIGEAGVQGYVEKPVTQKALRLALGSLSVGSQSDGVA